MAGFKVVFHSIISGIFAASAGVAGKVAFDEALIIKGCLAAQDVLTSSQIWNWIEASQFLPSGVLLTDVCDHKVGPNLNFIYYNYLPFLINFNMLSTT